MEINIYEAKANFSKIIQMIADGTEDVIIISKNGKPTAQITRIAKKNSKRECHQSTGRKPVRR